MVRKLSAFTHHGTPSSQTFVPFSETSPQKSIRNLSGPDAPGLSSACAADSDDAVPSTTHAPDSMVPPSRWIRPTRPSPRRACAGRARSGTRIAGAVDGYHGPITGKGLLVSTFKRRQGNDLLPLFLPLPPFQSLLNHSGNFLALKWRKVLSEIPYHWRHEHPNRACGTRPVHSVNGFLQPI